MIKTYVLFFTICLPPFCTILAQEGDTIRLKTVTVYGIPLEKYASGSKTIPFKEEQIEQYTTAGHLLSQKSPIYFKTYGNNMLSSIAFRGTGSNHTAVLWNGLNINSRTLGQSDFNLLPLAGIESLRIQYGSASSLYGSGAIGGSIHTYSEPEWTDQLTGSINLGMGSFSTFASGVRLKYGNGTWEGKTRVYQNTSENDFQYQDITKAGKPLAKQVNAGYKQYGIAQDFYYSIATNKFLAIKGWHAFNYREIQPNMGISESNEHIEDKNTRLLLEYRSNSPKGYLISKIGYIIDDQRYNSISRILTRQWVAHLQYEKKIKENLRFISGGSWYKIHAEVENYNGDITENRGDVFASVQWNPSKKLTTTFSARQAFITGFKAPFAPSLGIEYKANHLMTFKGMFSRNFRVPTLNDRYWVPGGNPDISPEDGYSIETGVQITKEKENATLNAELTLYQMWVDNWIVWVPTGSIWSPQNARRVNSSGIEPHFDLTHRLNRFEFSHSLDYTYSISKNKRELNEFDRSVNKQLAYTPIHNGIVSSSIKYKNWDMQISYNYTGKRYITADNSTELPSFSLINTQVKKQVKVFRLDFAFGLQVNNLFNHDYQNLNLRAMPRRNLLLNIRVKL